MVSVQQLELDFKIALDEVANVPEQADVLALWSEFEQDLSNLPQQEQLRVAGSVLSELADLCKAKSEVLWEDWQDAHNSEGPVMSEGWLSGLTRQTQELDFSGLVSRSYKKQPRSEEDLETEDSLAGDADKSSVLAMLDAMEEVELKAQALAVSHSENVSEWIGAIASVMHSGEAQRLVDLQRQLEMPLVVVWLAALLGGFVMKQRGDFYATDDVWVSARDGDLLSCNHEKTKVEEV